MIEYYVQGNLLRIKLMLFLFYFIYIVNLIINYLELTTIGLLKWLTHPCWGN